MKRSIKLLLCTLAVLLAVPLVMCVAEKLGFDSFAIVSKAEAATIVDSGECGDDGDNATWTLDSDGLLTISGTGKMKDYTFNISSPWEKTRVSSVIILDGVTSIGNCAFYNCSGLISITIPNSVTSVGDNAFLDCDSLKKAYAPNLDSWLKIHFSDCDSNPCFYGADLYFNGELVNDVVVPDSITSIGRHAFYGCTGLMSITITDSVTSIGEYAFAYCSSLTSVMIPDSVTNIDRKVFYCCSSLTSIIIPDGVTNIGSSLFYGCSSLARITIPDSVTRIGDEAFDGCSSLTSITIPDSVTSIGYDAFQNCSSLTSITIPDSVTRIGYGAFYGCSSLTSITIPDGVKSIGSSAFYDCSNLMDITISDSVTSIGDTAFYGCSSLTSITIPSGVTNIGGGAFSSCNSLTNITIPDGITNIGNFTFSNCRSLVNIAMPDRVTSIGEYAFYCCSGLTSITIPDGLKNIGKFAFYGCSRLTDITIPDSVKNIGSSAFSYCSFTDITIPDKVKNIGSSTFSYCGLTNITLGKGVTIIGTEAFYCCSGLTSIIIPDSVTSIGNYAFSGCRNLNSAYIFNPNCVIAGEASLSDSITIYSHAGFAVEEYAKKHNYNFVAIHIPGETVTFEATCTESGKQYQECKYCEKHINEIDIPALNHSPADAVEENRIEPTCISDGKYDEVIYCKVCNAELKRESRAIDKLGHDEIHHDAKAATCSEKGHNAFVTCTRCDYTTYEEVAPHGHTPAAAVEENRVEPTCINNGSYDSVVYCDICKAEISREKKTVASLGHREKYIEAKAATCTESGLSEGIVCSVCGETIKEQVEIKATGHTYNEDGVCTKCGEKRVAEKSFLQRLIDFILMIINRLKRIFAKK